MAQLQSPAAMEALNRAVGAPAMFSPEIFDVKLCIGSSLAQ
jgi:hypothetical protein